MHSVMSNQPSSFLAQLQFLSLLFIPKVEAKQKQVLHLGKGKQIKYILGIEIRIWADSLALMLR